MESANLKLPQHEVIGSNLGDPSNCFPFGIGSHSSSPSSSSSSPPFSSCSTGSVGNSNSNNPSASRHYKMCDDNNNNNNNTDHHESNNNVMIHRLGSSWNHDNLSSSYHMQLANKIKDEIISESFPKFTELLLNSPSSANIDNYTHFLLKNDCNEKDGSQIDGPDFGGHFSSSGFTTTATSQIYPSVNISSLNNYHQGQSFCSVMMMSQPGLNDSLGAFSFNGNFGVVDDQIQRPQERLSCDREIDQRNSSLRSEMEDLEKRSMRSNQSITAPNKKSRSEPKTPSCPPFKVRKEKLGDRIAALQQLVSPFGKTDTASVLMEAIGYIKFLQNQVETLSVPYMKKPSRHKSTTKTFQGIYQGLNKDDGIEEEKRDLRSRGLCLVPLSCMSYVTEDHGSAAAATIWPPPSFFGT